MTDEIGIIVKTDIFGKKNVTFLGAEKGLLTPNPEKAMKFESKEEADKVLVNLAYPAALVYIDNVPVKKVKIGKDKFYYKLEVNW